MASQRDKKRQDTEHHLQLHKVDRDAITHSTPLKWSVCSKYKIAKPRNSPFGVFKTTEVLDDLVKYTTQNRDSTSNMSHMKGARSNGHMADRDVLGVWSAHRMVFNAPMHNSAFHEKVSPGVFLDCLGTGVSRVYEQMRLSYGWTPMRSKTSNVKEMMEKLGTVLEGVTGSSIEHESLLGRTLPETVVFYANRGSAELYIYTPDTGHVEWFANRNNPHNTWGYLTGKPPVVGEKRARVETVRVGSEKNQGENTVLNVFCTVHKYVEVVGESASQEKKYAWQICGVRILTFTPQDVAWIP